MTDFKGTVLKKVSLLVVVNHDFKLQDCVFHQTDILKIKESPFRRLKGQDGFEDVPCCFISVIELL